MPENGPGGLPPGYRPVSPGEADRSELIYHLQQGGFLRLPDTSVAGGTSVTGFLLEVLNLDLASFRDEIRTMMRNHFVVDNPDETQLRPGDILVVSGAMPGLVGAMLRSDSPIKILRSTISGDSELADDSNHIERNPGFITFKAFNTVLRDHLADILEYGFYIEEPDG